MKDGLLEEWENGIQTRKEFYVNGKLHGACEERYPDGEADGFETPRAPLLRWSEYEDGELMSSNIYRYIHNTLTLMHSVDFRTVQRRIASVITKEDIKLLIFILVLLYAIMC